MKKEKNFGKFFSFFISCPFHEHIFARIASEKDMGNLFGKTLTSVMDLVLPRICTVCGRKLLGFERHLCTGCMADMPLTFNWSLPHNPMADKFNELIQRDVCKEGNCTGKHVPYCFASALFFFNSEACYRKIPYGIKYHGDVVSGRFFGYMLGERIASSGMLHDVDMIIPVPLFWSRKWERGYNQAEVIARGIAEATGAVVRTDILYRTHRTKTQTKLGIEEKSLNVRHAFGLKKEVPPQTRHILLVDDVFTTGATLHACYRTVSKAAGDARISIATLAMVSN